MRKIVLVIPVFNEDKYISKFIENLFSRIIEDKLSLNVMFVDDGSSDNTHKYLVKKQKIHKFKILKHSKNVGKGASMKSGYNYAKKNNYEAIIYMDGDCQHNPKYLKSFVKALENNSLVFGYRDLKANAPYIRKLGNKIVRILFRVLFNIKRRDILCGFIAIGKSNYDVINWKSLDYGVESEISAIAGKKDLQFAEMHIDTIYLDDKKGVSIYNAFFIMLKIPLWYFQY